MKVIKEAHLYELENFENKSAQGQMLQFIEKEPVSEGSSQLRTVSDGTTTEEVLAVAINRLQVLQSKFPCKENACAITHLEEALMWLDKRTANRVKAKVEGTNQTH